MNYEYVEPRRYKLKGGATSKDARGDVVIGRLTLRVGIILPKKKKYATSWVVLPSVLSFTNHRATTYDTQVPVG